MRSYDPSDPRYPRDVKVPGLPRDPRDVSILGSSGTSLLCSDKRGLRDYDTTIWIPGMLRFLGPLRNLRDVNIPGIARVPRDPEDTRGPRDLRV